MVQVSKQAAARFLLEKQGLLSGSAGKLWREELQGQSGIVTAVERLECVQVDPVNVLNRNQNLVLSTRVGAFKNEDVEATLAACDLIDYPCNARCFLPMRDWPLLKPLTWRFETTLAGEVDRLGKSLEQVYEIVREHGPINSRRVDITEKIAGWWDQNQPKTKVGSMALEILWYLGRLGIQKREVNERYYDLIDRVVPQAVQLRREEIDMEVAKVELLHKYMRAYRLFFPSHNRFGWLHQPAATKKNILAEMEQKGLAAPVEITGVKRGYWVLGEDVEALEAAAKWEVAPEATLLPPLDNLLWMRERLCDLFDFDYTWEIYIPVNKRKFGAYTMPCLVGDRIVGRLDAYVDRSRASLILETFYPEIWLTEFPSRTQKKVMQPIRQAVQVLSHACGVTQVSLADNHKALVRYLLP